MIEKRQILFSVRLQQAERGLDQHSHDTPKGTQQSTTSSLRSSRPLRATRSECSNE
jgi:hypothetical protein